MVDAVLTGTGEPNIESAIKLTSKLGIPFYSDEKCWTRVSDKIVFKQTCRKYGIPVAKEFDKEYPFQLEDFPIVVKPADNCFNRGLTICKELSEIEAACQKAEEYSPQKRIVIEKYIEGKQINIFYHMVGGKIQLSSVTESLINKGTPSSNYTVTLSQSGFTEPYLKFYDEKMRDMLRSLGCCNGTAILQGIANREGIFFLEINYRLDGLGFYNTLKDAYGIDAVRIISDLSLKGKSDFEIVDFRYPDPKVCCIYSVWTYQNCKVGKIVGVEDIQRAIRNVHIQCRCKEGMKLKCSKKEGMLLFNICFYEESIDKVKDDLNLINRILYVYDENMHDILEKFKDFE